GRETQHRTVMRAQGPQRAEQGRHLAVEMLSLGAPALAVAPQRRRVAAALGLEGALNLTREPLDVGARSREEEVIDRAPRGVGRWSELDHRRLMLAARWFLSSLACYPPHRSIPSRAGRPPQPRGASLSGWLSCQTPPAGRRSARARATDRAGSGPGRLADCAPRGACLPGRPGRPHCW